jgi:nitroimidazol reductase NimA-like FMN-containing flavoprotein (pyridoxamine 5'-phosphate oxidase superfamily)
MQKLYEKKIDDSFLLTKIPIRLACIKPTGVPTVLSLWYVVSDDKIYCATQKTAKIITYLKNNSACSFEIAGDSPPYRGIRGEGIAKILNDKGESVLLALINKYLGKKESNLSNFLKKNSKTEVAIEIEPQRIHAYDYSSRMKGV